MIDKNNFSRQDGVGLANEEKLKFPRLKPGQSLKDFIEYAYEIEENSLNLEDPIQRSLSSYASVNNNTNNMNNNLATNINNNMNNYDNYPNNNYNQYPNNNNYYQQNSNNNYENNNSDDNINMQQQQQQYGNLKLDLRSQRNQAPQINEDLMDNFLNDAKNNPPDYRDKRSKFSRNNDDRRDDRRGFFF